MTKEFSIIRNNIRHVVVLTCGIRVLLDSGAVVPVWVSGLKKLFNVFKGSYVMEGCFTTVSGFGGSGNESRVVCIPKIEFEDANLILKRVCVAASKNASIGGGKFDLVLSISIFKNGCLQIVFGSKSIITSISYLSFDNNFEYICIPDVEAEHAFEKYKGMSVMEGIHCLTQAEALAQGIPFN